MIKYLLDEEGIQIMKVLGKNTERDFHMRDYIICNHKRSKARVKVDVCEQCKRMAKCPDYKDYIQASLFPDFVKEMITTKAVKSPSMMKSKNIEPQNKHKQLALNL